jgi:uncharacterized protein YbaR (Trm112 family)
MLVAYGPNGQTVVADETPIAQLRAWSREHMLYCPNCRGTVHVRGGAEKRTQLHFAHQKGECAWSTESESLRHIRGKSVLAHWLRQQFPTATVTLEERLPEPNRIADVFVCHKDGRHWAIEFQCAPLDLDEWRKRHIAYRKAGIVDTWIIGNNRREKQEAFIEAILTSAQEVMFLDPQVTPARIWLRWPVARTIAQEWQHTLPSRAGQGYTPSLDGWVGRLGYGATLISTLPEVRLNEQARLIHTIREDIEARTHLLQQMSTASTVESTALYAYLCRYSGEEALRVVLIPLLNAYLRDPDLLRRYNYGRGQAGLPPDQTDIIRIEKARAWLKSLEQRGFSIVRLQEFIKAIPFVGPYAAFVSYAETLLALAV